MTGWPSTHCAGFGAVSCDFPRVSREPTANCVPNRQHPARSPLQSVKGNSVRNLDKLFAPRSVALIGATSGPGSVGAVVARNLRGAGFAGELTLVDPHRRTIDGMTVYPDVASL